MEIIFVIVGIVVVIAVAGVLVYVGTRAPSAEQTLESRLAEFATQEKQATLEEIELSQTFTERIILPMVRSFGEWATRFTPQSSLQDIQHLLDLAGNPKGMDPITLYATRIIATVVAVGFVFLIATINQDPTSFLSWKSGAAKIFLAAGGAGALGFNIPTMMLRSKITRRQDMVIKAMPDALDLLTVCVEAGLGFDQAMAKVAEKWENELSLSFARVIQEIRLGKTRRDALRDMADRLDIPDMTSFVAALIQADQLGVSMGKVLRIQSEQMRMRRRQRAEKKAHEAPIIMLIPMAFLIFPSIYIVLLGPSVLQVLNSGIIGGGLGN